MSITADRRDGAPTGDAERPRLIVILPVALAGLVAAGALLVPNLLASNLCSNETAAIATLRNLAACQQQVQKQGAVDADGDGVGEFGTLGELTGVVPVRAAPGRTAKVLSPPILSPALAKVTTEGWVEKSHYAFAVFLPRAGGGWIRETGTVPAGPAESTAGCVGSGNAAPGGAGVSAEGTVDAALAAREWCAIAWPRMVEDRTRRVFLVTARGELLWTANERGVFCGTVLPAGPADVLPPGWKPGDPVVGGYESRLGEVWLTSN